MTHKQRSIQYSKREGNERVEYWVVNDDGIISTCAPRSWHALKLEDKTSPTTMEKVAMMRYKSQRKQFRDQVDDNAWLRTVSIPDDKRYQALCERAEIVY